MTRFATLAATAFLLASSSAFAGDVYNFKIGGQSIHIEQPRNCKDSSCVIVSIPGIYEQNTKRKRARDAEDDQASIGRDKTDVKPAPTDTTTPVAAPAPSPATIPQPGVAAAPASHSLEPANGSPQPSTDAATPAAPRSEPSPGGLAAPKVAAVGSNPAPAATPSPVSGSPLGVWLTEEKEGKVRIEQCGINLCGYSVDAKTNANGDKVLINMKPGSEKWTGRIHDPKSGSTYDSTIAMNGSDRLRVQGCAFGGMFCGGQTWTRVN